MPPLDPTARRLVGQLRRALAAGDDAAARQALGAINQHCPSLAELMDLAIRRRPDPPEDTSD